MSKGREQSVPRHRVSQTHKLYPAPWERKSSMSQMWALGNVRPTPQKLEVSSPQVGSHEEGLHPPASYIPGGETRVTREKGSSYLGAGRWQVWSSSRQCAGSSGLAGLGRARSLVNLERTCPTQKLSDPFTFLNVFSPSNKIHLLEVSLISHQSGSFIDGSWGWFTFPKGPSSVTFREKDQCLTFWLWKLRET